jgi:hypothetical protein
MARKKLEKPSRAMRDAAIRTLHEVISAAGTPTYTRVSAAKALLRDDADDDDPKDPLAPPGVVIMPHNFRDERVLGITRSEGLIMILYDDRSEQGRADLERWRAEIAAEIESEHPVLLPPPDKPRPLTGAERVRRWRERRREANAASQSASAR